MSQANALTGTNVLTVIALVMKISAKEIVVTVKDVVVVIATRPGKTVPSAQALPTLLIGTSFVHLNSHGIH
jgi:hypothetical protein